MKNERQAAILSILEQERIETQSQLLQSLAEHGITTTQATLSRDIREMNLVKDTGPDGVGRYVQQTESYLSDSDRRMQQIFRESCISFDHAMHTVVIKTLPGLASAVCAAVDAMYDDSILGTVAGDDTGILIMRNPASAERLCLQLRRDCHRR